MADGNAGGRSVGDLVRAGRVTEEDVERAVEAYLAGEERVRLGEGLAVDLAAAMAGHAAPAGAAGDATAVEGHRKGLVRATLMRAVPGTGLKTGSERT